MFNPFLDTSKMTEKELLKKIEDTNSRIIKARMSGIKYEIVDSMNTIILSCQEELRTREGIKNLELAKKEDPCIFESDKDYTIDEPDENTKKSINRPEW